MSTPNKYAPETNILPPRCPYCSADLDEVRTFQWVKQLGQGLGIMLCVYCPNAECRKVISIQTLIVPHAEERNIVGPS